MNARRGDNGGRKVGMKLTVKYDSTANAAYIRFSSDTVHESEEVSAGIVFDYDESGHIVGMEILDARKHLPSAVLTEAA